MGVYMEIVWNRVNQCYTYSLGITGYRGGTYKYALSLALTHDAHEFSCLIQFPNMTDRPKSHPPKSEVSDGRATLHNRSINDLLENAADAGNRWSATNCVERKKRSRSWNCGWSYMMKWNIMWLIWRTTTSSASVSSLSSKGAWHLKKERDWNNTMSSSSRVFAQVCPRHSEGCFSANMLKRTASQAVCL